MQLTIGSHPLAGTDGIVTVRGMPQIALEWGQAGIALRLTMDLYDADGGRVARLRRNHWTFNDADRFAFTGSRSGFHLVDSKLGQVVLRARVVGRDTVAITQGTFSSAAGDTIEVTAEDWGDPGQPETRGALAAQPTKRSFGPDEIIAIDRALATPGTPVACPRCGCPLIRERFPGVAAADRLVVSCVICGCHSVSGETRASE